MGRTRFPHRCRSSLSVFCSSLSDSCSGQRWHSLHRDLQAPGDAVIQSQGKTGQGWDGTCRQWQLAAFMLLFFEGPCPSPISPTFPHPHFHLIPSSSPSFPSPPSKPLPLDSEAKLGDSPMKGSKALVKNKDKDKSRTLKDDKKKKQQPVPELPEKKNKQKIDELKVLGGCFQGRA